MLIEVREAADGLEALHRIDESVPDLVVLDLDLPRINGHGVLADLNAQPHTAAIPVIIVTGTDDAPDAKRVVRVLRKPVSPDWLIVAVAASLGRRSIR
jgi:CheY-like chemotaxis protein